MVSKLPKLQSQVIFLEMCKIWFIFPLGQCEREDHFHLIFYLQCKNYMWTLIVWQRRFSLLILLRSMALWHRVQHGIWPQSTISFTHSFKYSTYNFEELLSAKQGLLLMIPMNHIISFSWNKGPSWGGDITYRTKHWSKQWYSLQHP